MALQVGGMILEKIVEKLVDPIIRQFSYLFCYKSNIKTLQDKIQDIQNTRSDVTRQVDQAHRNLEIIGSEVEAWLGKVEDIGKTADEILQGTDKVTNGCLNGWCPNLKQRYLLSRKAVKQIVIVKELRNEGEKHTKLSYPALPASMAVFSTNAGSEVFKSRVSKTKEVIEALKDNSVTKIGICGLGGIGKTKMAKDVYDRVKVENLFDEVAMAVVSQNLDLKNIQDQLASQLQLKLEANNSIEDRGRRFSQRLAQGKRILVILDDLWEELDLKEIGIPVGDQGHTTGCKELVLLPSMEKLDLFGVDDVVKLVDGKTNPTASFNKLETILVYKCDSMEVVFDLEGVDVVVNENREKVIVFSQLHTITLLLLPELKYIWKNGPKEIRLQAGSHFQNLKVLKLHWCHKIEYVLSVSMAKLLVNLERIEISDCKSMEQVIKMDDDEEEEGITRERDKIVFPQLRKLYLYGVGLKVFCQGNHHLEFPALEDVSITQCPNMNNFCSGSLSTPNLMSMKYRRRFEEGKSIWKGDLNKTVQYIYQNYEEEEEKEEEEGIYLDI